jgi:hypothetical protein
LIRSPGFNRLAARTHSRIQKMKMQWGGTEEELRQLKEQEKLLNDAEHKFKSLDSDTNRTTSLGQSADVEGPVIWVNSGKCLKMSFGIEINKA